MTNVAPANSTTFFGYPGQVWQVCYQALSWLSGQLQGGAAPAIQQASATLTVFQTLRNGVNAVAAWQTGAALQAEVQNLIAVEALPITLDPTTTIYFTDRITGITNAATGISALPQPVSVTNVIALLSAGTPAVPDPGYLEWCMTFGGEPLPTGISVNNLLAGAAGMVTAWQTVASTIAVFQGSSPTQAYDTAARMARTSLVISNMLASFTSAPPFAVATTNGALWNQVVALPTILLDAASLTGTPNSLQNQQCGVIRFALLTMVFSLARFLLSLRRPVLEQVNLAGVRAGDSLMDIAARVLGDFEQWSAIAALNGLAPPYPGQDNGALVGKQVLLPSSTGTIVSGAAVPTYAANVLGTDYDFGPINTGIQVTGLTTAPIPPSPPWTGDIQVITGLLNFARAIGRRLQTPVGSLIYHPTYGSRIPPEVGAIASLNEAQRLAAFGVSAIAADPRTGNILQPTAQLLPGFAATFQALVQPISPNSQAVLINETISTLP